MMKKIAVVVSMTGLTAALPMANFGCAGATNATDSTISYLHGDQHATLGASPQQLTDATIAAGQELQLPVDSHASDGLVGRVVLHTTDGTKVEVSIKAIASDQSEVIVRVGTFGDKVLQQRMLDKIKAHVLTKGAEPVVKHTSAEPTPAATEAVTPPATPAPSAVAPAPTPAPTPPPAQAPAPENPLSPTPVNPLAPTPANPLSPDAPATTRP